MARKDKKVDASTVKWLQDVLIVFLESVGLPEGSMKRVRQFAEQVPDFVLMEWAAALDVDVEGYKEAMPDASDWMRTDAGREAVRENSASYRVVPTARTVTRVIKSALKLFRSGNLPIDTEAAIRDVAALGLSSCVPPGEEVADELATILGSDALESDQLLAGYFATLTRSDQKTAEMVDSVIVGSSYGRLSEDRMQEVRKLAGVDPPALQVKEGGRSPTWNELWKSIWRR